jgi:outer membrane lipoprotein SlyB
MQAVPRIRRDSIPSHVPTLTELGSVLAGAVAGGLVGLVAGGLVYGSLVVGLFGAMAGAAAGMVVATGETKDLER